MTQMQGLMLYNEYLESFEQLAAKDFKNLLLNAMHYNRGEEIGELTPKAALLWPMISAKIDQAREAYEKRCQMNRAITEKRMRKQRLSGKKKDGTQHGDVLFSETDGEHLNSGESDNEKTVVPDECRMNTDSSAAYTNGDVTYTNGDVTYTNGDVTYTNGDVTYTNGDATYTNGDVTYTNRNQHNITETETETETVTETETETETETVTVTETETETVSEAEAQAIAEAQVQAITEAQTADSGIDGGIGIGGGIGIDGGNGGGTDTDSKKPTEDEVRRYCAQYALLVDPDRFYRYYEERDWMANGEPIQSWRAMADHWQKLGEQQRTAKAASVNTPPPSDETGSASCDLAAFIRASMDTPFDQL